jgi:hypothetical protein
MPVNSGGLTNNRLNFGHLTLKDNDLKIIEDKFVFY